MCKRNDSDLFFTCSLIECIAEPSSSAEVSVVAGLGRQKLEFIYDYADVLHCEPIQKVAEDVIADCGLHGGNFDNVSDCLYEVPSVFTIGKVYARLIEDLSAEDDVIDTLIAVYRSWMNDVLSDYNEGRIFPAERVSCGELSRRRFAGSIKKRAFALFFCLCAKRAPNRCAVIFQIPEKVHNIDVVNPCVSWVQGQDFCRDFGKICNPSGSSPEKVQKKKKHRFKRISAF